MASADEPTPEEREALEALAEYGRTQLAEDARTLLAEIDAREGSE